MKSFSVVQREHFVFLQVVYLNFEDFFVESF